MFFFLHVVVFAFIQIILLYTKNITYPFWHHKKKLWYTIKIRKSDTYGKRQYTVRTNLTFALLLTYIYMHSCKKIPFFFQVQMQIIKYFVNIVALIRHLVETRLWNLIFMGDWVMGWDWLPGSFFLLNHKIEKFVYPIYSSTFFKAYNCWSCLCE